jgi:phosphate transport system substrate-binding protein
VEYSATEGQKMSTAIGYIPLPKNVVDKVLAASKQIQ